jgi:2-dehydro-3-deoxygalactonokinase
MGSSGSILESRSAEKGILSVRPAEFPGVLEEHVGDWIAQGEAPIVMSGMVGSRQGWSEAPYVLCPAGLAEIAAALHEVRWDGKRAWIVPGLACRDAAGVHDVLRGEEVQIFGSGVEGLVCLPGTHSKWVEVTGGRIIRFCTYMTGEVYAVLRQHSILSRMMTEGAPDRAAFADGVARSGDPGGLLHHLFGVRTRGLMGELAQAAAGSYLSGILVGHELHAFAQKQVFFLGARELVALYAHAAALLGIESRTLDPDAAARGMFRLGGMLAPGGGRQ